MRQMLLQNAAAVLLQNATEVYYEMRQVFYCKMRQLLQIATVHTKSHKSIIDLFLTNRPLSFQKTKATETGIIDLLLLF